jgi:hypothetical protein
MDTSTTDEAGPAQVELKYQSVGRHGRIKVLLRWPDGSFTDTFDVLNEISRKRFTTRLIERHPGLDQTAIAHELDRVAETLASQSMSDEGDDDSGLDDDQLLIQIGQDPDRVELFHTGARHDAEPYARIVVGEHFEVWPVRSRAFSNWIRHAFFEERQRSPEAQAFTDAVNTIAAKACSTASPRRSTCGSRPSGTASRSTSAMRTGRACSSRRLAGTSFPGAMCRCASRARRGCSPYPFPFAVA